MAKFKRGDTVMLKSGGPAMTVESSEFEDAVKCVWFDDKDNLRDTSFHQDMLEEAAEEEPPSPLVG